MESYVNPFYTLILHYLIFPMQHAILPILGIVEVDSSKLIIDAFPLDLEDLTTPYDLTMNKVYLLSNLTDLSNMS